MPLKAGVGNLSIMVVKSRKNWPFKALTNTNHVESLAARLLKESNLPPKAATDAAHIAISAVNGMNYLLTWNCRHIANAEMTPRVREICESAGFGCPIICTPQELMGGYAHEGVERSDC